MKNLFLVCVILFILKSTSVLQACTGSLTWNNPVNNTSGASYSNSQFGNNTLCIQGTFTVNEDFTFNDCHIVMDQGAKIIIASNKKLTLNACNIHSCDGVNMWDGIYLSSTSNLSSYPVSLEIIGGSIVQDAETLIVVTKNNGVVIHDSYLNKNCINVYMDGSYGASSTLDLYNTQITSYGTWGNPFTRGNVLLSPYSGSPTYFGIELYGLNNISIGNASHNYNLFDNVSIAVWSTLTNINVKNNHFDYCGPVATGPNVILCDNFNTLTPLNLTVGGTNSNEKNIFNIACNAITVTYLTNVSIIGNEFNSVTYPIKINNGFPIYAAPPSTKIIITNNKLLNFDEGIVLKNCLKLIIGDISYNRLNYYDDLTYNSSIGISLNNTLITQNNMYVNNNEIRNCLTGIRATNLRYPCEINGNNIYISDNIPVSTYIGIDGFNLRNTLINRNTIQRLNQNSATKVEGIRGQSLTFSSIAENTLTNSSNFNFKGIHLRGGNLLTQIECNNLNDCPEAIYLGTPGNTIQQAILSDQGSTTNASDNQWQPTTNAFIRILGSFPPFRWYYKVDNFNNVATFNNRFWPQTSNSNLTPTLVSTDNSYCGSRRDVNPETDLYPTIRKTISFEENQVEYQYISNSIVFETILENQDLLNDTICRNWYDSIFDTNLGKLERIEYLFFDFTSENDSLINAAKVIAKSLLTEIVPENTIEENIVVFLDLIINKIYQNQQLNGQDSINLEDIACQNSIVGGKAVIWSREFLNSNIDDEFGCESMRIGKFHIIDSFTNNDQISVYPNPSNGTVTLNGNYLSYQLEIFSITGQSILKLNHVQEGVSIKLNLTAGYYYYIVNVDEGKITTKGKLSIIK